MAVQRLERCPVQLCCIMSNNSVINIVQRLEQCSVGLYVQQEVHKLPVKRL